MAFIFDIITNAFAKIGDAIIYKKATKKRKNIPCFFDNGISEDEFVAIVECVCKSIDRIDSFDIIGTLVNVYVSSQSGITKWFFQVDFNDYGKITGKYWIFTQNYDSKIPESIAQSIKIKIEKALKTVNITCE